QGGASAMWANALLPLRWRLSVTVVLLLAAGPLLHGAADRAEGLGMLIESADLQSRLTQPGLSILDTRPEAEYAKGHIPGAIRVDVRGWQELGKKEGGFHDARSWGAKVGQLGISQDSPVVVYGSNPSDTARIWWTLKYVGLPNVAVLNGGWELWTKEQR